MVALLWTQIALASHPACTLASMALAQSGVGHADHGRPAPEPCHPAPTVDASSPACESHCSRSDLAADGGVHRRCVPGASRTDPAIRFRVPQPCAVHFDDALHGRFSQDIAGEVGDFVLRRADGLWAYQLAVVVDDAAQGVTQVVRGADLLDSTPRQILLQRALGLPTPAYAHLPLVLDADGRKLSKSLASLPLDADEPLPALRAAWRLLGQDPRVLSAAGTPAALLRAALDGFDPDRIPRMAVAPGHDAIVTDSP